MRLQYGPGREPSLPRRPKSPLPVSTDQEIGTVLDEKYEVLEHLGGGGVGEVYLVRHLHLDEKRVVKVLRSDRVQDPDAQKRFLREARFATQIKHPNVATLYDYSRLDDGSFYMVWEHIAGEDVATRLRRDGAFPVRAAVDLGVQALAGLDAIHAAGMIHRDISPDNLMLADREGSAPRLKIIDLGLAKDLAADPDLKVTQDGMFMGKLLYCAPEQAGLHKGETLDHRSDLYSLGLVLYEMVTGKAPFEADTPHGAVFLRLSEAPAPMAEKNPAARVPAALEKVVRKALEREREDRFPDARSFAEALQGVARGLSESATQKVPTLAEIEAGRGRIAPAESRPARARELTREEKDDLLAQIERAAVRARAQKPPAPAGSGSAPQPAPTRAPAEPPDPAQVELALERLRKALAASDLAAAREAYGRARELTEAAGGESGPGTALASLGTRVEQLARIVEHRERIDEASAMVERYIQGKQLTLARLALDTLLELSPTHPRRGDFESWVDVMAGELAQERKGEDLLAGGRQALVNGDYRGARRALGQLRKVDDELADDFARELEGAEREHDDDEEFGDHQRRLEELIAAGEGEAAQAEVQRLAELGAAKVTVDLYRVRIAEAHVSARGEAQTAAFVEAFQERLDEGDFAGARGVLGELQRIAPEDPRLPGLVTEVSARETEVERRRAIAQGEEQVERLIEAGDADGAALALRLLLRIFPGHKRRRALEKRIKKLEKT